MATLPLRLLGSTCRAFDMTEATPVKVTPVGLIAMGMAIVSFSFWRMWLSVATWWILLILLRKREARRGGPKRPYPDRRTWKLVAPAGLTFGLNISLLFTAVTRTSIAHIEFIGAMASLIIVPAGALLFGERPNWSALRWGVISLVGDLLVRSPRALLYTSGRSRRSSSSSSGIVLQEGFAL